jgi:hypothetical protein
MSNEKQQTSLEQFAIALYEGGYLQGNGDEIQELLEKHLEIHKQEVIDALQDGHDIELPEKICEQYYNERHGGKK